MESPTITVAEMVSTMRQCGIRTSPLKVQREINNGVYDFAYATKMERRVYTISRKGFYNYMRNFYGVDVADLEAG